MSVCENALVRLKNLIKNNPLTPEMIVFNMLFLDICAQIKITNNVFPKSCLKIELKNLSYWLGLYNISVVRVSLCDNDKSNTADIHNIKNADDINVFVANIFHIELYKNYIEKYYQQYTALDNETTNISVDVGLASTKKRPEIEIKRFNKIVLIKNLAEVVIDLLRHYDCDYTRFTDLLVVDDQTVLSYNEFESLVIIFMIYAALIRNSYYGIQQVNFKYLQ